MSVGALFSFSNAPHCPMSNGSANLLVVHPGDAERSHGCVVIVQHKIGRLPTIRQQHCGSAIARHATVIQRKGAQAMKGARSVDAADNAERAAWARRVLFAHTRPTDDTAAGLTR